MIAADVLHQGLEQQDGQGERQGQADFLGAGSGWTNRIAANGLLQFDDMPQQLPRMRQYARARLGQRHPRPLRTNNRALQSRSRLLMRRLSTDWSRSSNDAARVRLPSSVTATNACHLCRLAVTPNDIS